MNETDTESDVPDFGAAVRAVKVESVPLVQADEDSAAALFSVVVVQYPTAVLSGVDEDFTFSSSNVVWKKSPGY